MLLGQEAEPAFSDIEDALDEVRPWTGIVLAELLIRLGHPVLATRRLERALNNENQMVRLQTLETIVETGLFHPTLKPSIEAITLLDDPSVRPYDRRLANYVLQHYED